MVSYRGEVKDFSEGFFAYLLNPRLTLDKFSCLFRQIRACERRIELYQLFHKRKEIPSLTVTAGPVLLSGLQDKA
jgi:hypothetical protein